MSTTKPRTWGELPESIRDTLSDNQTISHIEEIARAQGLSEMEQGFLVRLCSMLMKGELAPGLFVGAISEELSISKEKAALIAQTINHDIFASIKEALKEIHGGGSGVVRLDPSLVTCLPAQMSKEAALRNKAPGNKVVGNIMEQKLGGAFRLKSDQSAVTGGAPREIVPPPPEPLKPAPLPKDGTEILPPRQDPYRDHDL
jgi:hypothetical protein